MTSLEPDAREALQDERVVARAVLERLEHARRAADRVEVVRARDRRSTGSRLREDRDDRRREVVDVLDEGDGLLATHVERRDRAGEQHRVADGQNRDLLREIHVLLVEIGCELLVCVAHDVSWLGGERHPRDGA